MKTPSAPPTKPVARSTLTVRVPAADQIPWFDDLLARHHPLGAGRRDIVEIARFATTFTQLQRRRLNLPRKKGTQCFYQVPGYGVFHQVLRRMDAEAFATLLTALGRDGSRWPACCSRA